MSFAFHSNPRKPVGYMIAHYGEKADYEYLNVTYTPCIPGLMQIQPSSVTWGLQLRKNVDM